MPATCKADLVAVTKTEFTKLWEMIHAISSDDAMVRDDDGISIKDIIAHRAHWIMLFLGWYADGQAGTEVFFPAKGYKWNELPRYNADLRATQVGIDWATAVADLEKAHNDLTRFLASKDNTALYVGPMPGAKSTWTIGRWAEAAGPSHYRSARKNIRKRLKELA